MTPILLVAEEIAETLAPEGERITKAPAERPPSSIFEEILGKVRSGEVFAFER